MSMDVLARSNVLLQNKAFRDKVLKAVQYLCKVCVELPAFPLTDALPSLKTLASHISSARRLYRFGQFFRGLEGFLKLVDGPITSSLRFAKLLFLQFSAFWTDIFDALSYYKSVVGGDRSRADYWGSFFYTSLLAVGAMDQLIAFHASILRAAELRRSLKVEVVRLQSDGASEPGEKNKEILKELDAIKCRQFDIVVDLVRRIGDALTASKSLFPFMQDKNLTVSVGGMVGAIIGTWQVARGIK